MLKVELKRKIPKLKTPTKTYYSTGK